MSFGYFAFYKFDCLCRIRMSTEIVPKQQWIDLVGVTINPNMNIGSTLPLRLIEEKLLPQFGILVFALRHMIVSNSSRIFVSNIFKSLPYLIIQFLNSDLNIDNIFCS